MALWAVAVPGGPWTEADRWSSRPSSTPSTTSMPASTASSRRRSVRALRGAGGAGSPCSTIASQATDWRDPRDKDLVAQLEGDREQAADPNVSAELAGRAGGRLKDDPSSATAALQNEQRVRAPADPHDGADRRDGRIGVDLREVGEVTQGDAAGCTWGRRQCAALASTGRERQYRER